MAAFDFPANPTLGQVYSEGDVSFVWIGYAWVAGQGGAPADFVLKAGDTMTGPLTLPADPTAALQAATKQYADGVGTSLTGSMVSKAGDTMSGALTLFGAPTEDLHAAPKSYADSKLAKSGGAMTGGLILFGDPAAPMEAATKQYVDGLVASGQEFVGTFDAAAGTIAWTTASGGSGNSLPAAAAGNNGWYLIAEVAGSAPPTGSPAGAYESGDWLLSDGVAWTHLALGGSTATTAAQVAVSPLVGGAADVQVALTNLEGGKLKKAGDSMSGPLMLAGDPTDPSHAVRKSYIDAINAALTAAVNNKVNRAGDAMTGTLYMNLPSGGVHGLVVTGAVGNTGTPLYASGTAGAQGMIHVRPRQGERGYITFTEDAVSDRWAVGIDPNNAALYFRLNTQVGAAKATLDAAGGLTIAAGLTLAAQGFPAIVMRANAGTAAYVIGQSAAGQHRWVMQYGNGEAESGGNAGSNFVLTRYTDAGAAIDEVLKFFRSTGLGIVKGDPTAPLGIATKQYVDSVVGGGSTVLTVNTYADLVALAGTALQPNVKQVRMLGYWWPNDQGAALWRVTTTNPNHLIKLAWGSSWLEMIPWPDGSINFASFGFRPGTESGAVEDATPYLNKLKAYIDYVRSGVGGHASWNIGTVFFPPGEHWFKTKPNPISDLYSISFIGISYCVFYKDFCVDPNNANEAIFNFGSNVFSNEFENIRWTAGPNSMSGGIGKGCFISIITTTATSGDNVIRDCYVNSGNRVAWNFITDGQNGASGVPAVRGMLIENCQMFGGSEGSMRFQCTSGVDLVRVGCALSGSTNAQVYIVGAVGNECSNINFLGGAYSDIVINHANNINIDTTCMNNIITDYCNNFNFRFGRCYGNVSTTVNTHEGQITGSVHGTANLLGPNCQGRGYVPGAVSCHANSEWDKTP